MIARCVYPFDVIARVLAERLQGCQPSAELRSLVRSRGVDWERVVAYASAQYVLPAFAAALQELELTASLDQQLGAFLDAIHAANEERNSELCHELAAAVGVLNRAGIEPALLKGAIRLAEKLYPDHGWRMLRDLDLLVPQASLAEAVRAFQKAGYTSCGSGGEIRRRGGVCQIDLHTELFCTPPQVRLLGAADTLERTRPVAFGDGRVRVPVVEHQLVHLIGHSQIRHFGHAFGRISLRDRLETAALVHWGPEAVDWRAVSERFVAAGYRRPLLSFLLALSDCAFCAVPVTERSDRLTVLQQRRIALQARSTTFAYLGSRLGWWISAFWNQLEETDGGERKGISDLKSLMTDRRAIPRMARAFWQRQRHLVHVSPYLGWLIAQ